MDLFDLHQFPAHLRGTRLVCVVLETKKRSQAQQNIALGVCTTTRIENLVVVLAGRMYDIIASTTIAISILMPLHAQPLDV